MFIIWGSTTITSKVTEGAFYCPRCRVHTSYVQRRVKEFFTLYFIPIFPTRTLGEYVECRDCGDSFHPAILEHSAAEIEERQRPWTCVDCQGLNPPSEMRCLNCHARRVRVEEATPAAPARDRQTSETFRGAPPRPTPPAPAPPPAAGPDLATLIASNRCKDCGVVNSLVALHCKSCGVRLRSS